MTEPGPPPAPETPATPEPAPRPSLGWAGTAIKLMAALLIAGLAYVLFQAGTNHQAATGLSQFKRGTLTALEIIPDPPAQPEQKFTAPDGRQASLLDYRGKVILVNYWATWCPPCVKEMPTLSALHEAFKDQGFAVVAISVDREMDVDKSRAMLAELTGGALTFYHDPRMETVYPARARGFPTSILYDREGREIARLAGEADWDDEVAHGLIAHALAQQTGS